MTKGLNPNYQLKAASLSDVSWLIELRMQTMGDYLQAAGLDVSEEALRGRVQQAFECTQIVTLDNQNIGMIKVVRERSVWKLLQLQILPQFQCRGFGTLLIKDLIEGARRASMPVQLSVLKVNPSKSLYERLGFYVLEEKEGAYVMQADA